MKSLIKLLPLLLLLPSLALAEPCAQGGAQGGSQGWSAAGGCSPSAIFDNLNATANLNVVSAAGWVATKFTWASSYTVTKYVLMLYDIDGVGTVSASLYEDNAGAIGNLIADTTVSVGNADIPNGTFTNIDFTLATPKAGQTGTLWIKVTASAGNFYIKNGVKAGYTYQSNSEGPFVGYSSSLAIHGCAE